MLLVILGFIAPTLIWLWCSDWSPSFEDRTDAVFTIIFLLGFTGIATVAGACAMVVATHLLGTSVMDDQPSHTGVMVSMRSADGISGKLAGNLFMMTGYIGSDQYYYWYEQRSDGAFESHKVMAGQRIYIYEQKRADGQVVIYDWHITTPSWSLGWLTCQGPDTGQTYNFYIPEGSIQKTFKLQ